jgi:chaperonin GroEL
MENKLISSNSSNIVEENDYRNISEKTLETIANSLRNSLGYYGSSTIIEDKVNGHVATKDGYTILSSLKFESPLATTIYEIIKKISFNLVQTVGDGSTSSVVIAQSLFTVLNNAMKDDGALSKYSPKEVFDTLKSIEEIISKGVKEMATPIDEDNFDIIRKIAEVSNNNDAKVGSNIYDIYKVIGNDGFIYLENSNDSEDHFKYLNGLEFATGMIAEDFSNNKNKPECNFKEPFIFMCNDRLDSTDLNYMVDSVGNLVARHTKPMVIIAKSFSAEFVSCWIINKKQNPDFNICLVDFNFANKNQEEIFKDIALYTKSTIYDKTFNSADDFKKNFYTMLGSCDEISISNKTTKLVGRKCSDKELEDRVKYIDEEIQKFKDLKDESFDSRIFQLETRKANLNSTIVKYYVGGDTELEKNNRKYLIEDSIFACKAALETGYVCGGNLAIPKFINTYMSKTDMSSLENILFKLVKESFIQCYKCVLNNASIPSNDINNIIEQCVNNDVIYNLKTKRYETEKETYIVNSAKTEIEILKAVISIIGILVTSNQFICKSLV